MFENGDLMNNQFVDDEKNDVLNSMNDTSGLEPVFDNKKSEFGGSAGNDFSVIKNEGGTGSMMTPVNGNESVEQFQTPIVAETNEQFQTPIITEQFQTPIIEDKDDELGGFTYLENEHNLEIPKFNKDDVDDEEPFSTFKLAGKWIREAVDLENYRNAVESMGAEVAKYKWAFDQGDMGDFDWKDFSSEMVKSGVRSIGVNTLNMAGNIMSMLGANVKPDENDLNSDSVVRKNILPKMSDTFMRLGKTFREYATKVEDIEFLSPNSEAYSQEPSFARLANVLGSGASQVLMMGAMSKAIGSAATYGLYSAGSGSDVFVQSYEKDEDLGKANTLAVANAGVSFAIDKIFNPLPNVVEKNAKITSRMIADDMLGAPLKEGGTEVLQQLLAENLVRKIGIDDTQDLFEGLIESALGSFMGSGVLVGANGVSYASARALENVHKRMALRGISDEDFELAKNNMLAFIETKPEAFEKILSYNLEENLKRLEEEAKHLENRSERKKTLSEIKKFDEVYERMKDKFTTAIGDEKKGAMAARLFEANAVTLYEADKTLTPEKYIGGLLPDVKSMKYDEFKRLNNPGDNMLYHFIGVNAKGIDLNRLAEAYQLEKEGYTPYTVWAKTGWFRAADDMMRMEVSDKDAKIKLIEDIVDDYEHEGITALDFSQGELRAIEKEMVSDALILKQNDGLIEEGIYWDFIKYLDMQKFDEFWEDTPFYDETFDKNLTKTNDNHEVYIKRFKEALKYENIVENYDKLKGSDLYGDEADVAFAEAEKLRFNEFMMRYWNRKFGLEKESFKKLEKDKSKEFEGNKEFEEKLEEIEKEYKEKKALRLEKLKENNIEDRGLYFWDIDKEYNFRKYKLFMGDFSDTKIDMNFKPRSYVEAFKPLKHSELFFENSGYKLRFLPEYRKKALIPLLDKMQNLYLLQKHREYILKTDRDRIIKENAVRNYNVYDENSPFKRERRAIELKKVQNGMEFKLGDILDHELMYKSYPEIRDAKVSFTAIEGGAPHHFYYNRDEGYVLEIDAEQLDFANLKNVFLQGASFVIQNIEDFDYTFTLEQQRNLMDRAYYLAKSNTDYIAIDELRKFIDTVMPDLDYRKFIVKKEVPVSLLGIAHSKAVGNHNKRTETFTYSDIDFDKLEYELKKRYIAFNTKDDAPVLDFAYQNFVHLKNGIAHMITTYARTHGGFSFITMPWSGILSQGNMDDRAMLKRDKWDEDDVGLLHWEHYMPQLMERGEVRNSSDVTNMYAEFKEYDDFDKEHLDETIENMAKGAYDEANKIIFLFENAKSETILHETFHYFYDVMEKSNLSQNMAFDGFRAIIDELKVDFLKQFNIYKSDSGKYFAFDEVNNDLVDFLKQSFDSQEALVEAGAKELFVIRIMNMLNMKASERKSETSYEGVVLFCKWMKNMIEMLNIDGRKASKGGARVIKFIRKNNEFKEEKDEKM